MSAKREAERDFLYVKYFAVMVFIIVAIAMLSWSFTQGIAYALFKIDGEAVYGTVVKIEEESRGNFFISYSFIDHNGDRRNKTRFVHYGRSLKVKSGDKVGVTFSRLYPNISDLTALVPYLKIGFWVMVIGATIFSLLSVYSVFSILRVVKHHKEDQYY